jgi:uncharacterized protein YdeI (YjbR/CyaY-like superfamily)
MIPTEGFAKIEVRSAAELHDWLVLHYGQAESVWLVTWKKSPGAPYVSNGEVLDELIAFGWIDGLRRKLDEDRTMQLISPRKQQSWAETYKCRAKRLETEGRMQPSGNAAIAAARLTGKWDETAAVDALELPGDLASALGEELGAKFKAMAPSYRRNVLRWLQYAKRPETRAARVARIVNSAAQGEKLPQM